MARRALSLNRRTMVAEYLGGRHQLSVDGGGGDALMAAAFLSSGSPAAICIPTCSISDRELSPTLS